MSDRTHPAPAEPWPPTVDLRPQFHQDLTSLESYLTDMGEHPRQSLGRRLDILDSDDQSLRESEISDEEELDER